MSPVVPSRPTTAPTPAPASKDGAINGNSIRNSRRSREVPSVRETSITDEGTASTATCAARSDWAPKWMT